MSPTAQDRTRVLAALMRSSRPNTFSRVCFFLGAGAPRGAGVPLADELKDTVANSIFGADVPSAIAEGRLEDALELFQAMGGRDGYELVAAEIRRYSTQPEAYPLLADLIARGFVEAILTTNFDLLLDLLPAIRAVDFALFATDEDFDSRQVPTNQTLVAKLHGCSSDPASMRGSWTDTKELPTARSTVLSHYVSTYPMVFVGWAGLDADIVPILESISAKSDHPKIFWVNPSDGAPPAAIVNLLAKFDSIENYISLPADEFFALLHAELFPEAAAGSSDVDVARAILKRLSRSTARRDLETAAKIRKDREEFRHRLDALIRKFVASLKTTLAPESDLVIAGGRKLEVRTGGPVLILRHEVEYTDTGSDLTVRAGLEFYERSKPGIGAPLPPAIDRGTRSIVVEWGSEAGLVNLRLWLDSEVTALLTEVLTEMEGNTS